MAMLPKQGESTMNSDSAVAARPGWRKHLRLAVFWAIVSGFAFLALLPYLVTILPETSTVPLRLWVGAVAQNVVVFFLSSWVGLRLGESVNLDSPFARALVCHAPLPPIPLKTLAIAGASGLVLGFVILGLDTFLFWPALPPALVPLDFKIPRWKGFLASFYGGIAEELLCRLFVMTFLVWALWRLAWRTESKPPAAAFWTAILASAILFAVGHLPATARIWPFTPVVLVRNVTLNALPGFFFGVFYWKWGLEHAMLAHFCTDIACHVVGGG
jgi:membrane protease YdiL (CAAX protease family)